MQEAARGLIEAATWAGQQPDDWYCVDPGRAVGTPRFTGVKLDVTESWALPFVQTITE